MAKVKVTVSVDEGQRNRVAMLAALEERNFSQMWGVLVGEALQGREPSAEKPSKSAKSPPVFLSEPVLDAVSPQGRENVGKASFRRTKTCVHMIHPDAFCKWGCDSA